LLFQNFDLQVRLCRDTFVKFDGTERVVLQNILSEQAIRIQPDILLILWDLVAWKTVGELVSPWPPEDQEKIVQHLGMLHEASIVETRDDAQQRAAQQDNATGSALAESGLAAHVGGNVHINLDNHHVMLRDTLRTLSYRHAIQRVVQPGDVVLDLGCGTGILGFFAAKAGASRVYGIERRPDILMLAQAMAAANGLEQMRFIEGASSQILESRLQPKPSVLISEILGNGILEENVLEFTLDARNRFLTENPRLVPWKIEVWLFGFSAPQRFDLTPEVAALSQIYDLDLSLYGQVLAQKATLRAERFQPTLQQAITDDVLGIALDLTTLKDSVFVTTVGLPILHDGALSGVCGYFKAWLDETTVLTNAPWAPPTHWTQLLYTLPKNLPVVAGQTIQCELRYDGQLRLAIQTPGS
jgi:SAM-dependent methyltransferase